jgi:hypothetical protein
MATNNLRIIYNNLVDLSTTTITASSTQSGTPSVNNLKKDAKGSVWRSSPTTTSGTTVKAFLMIDLGSAKSVQGVVLAFTNLVSSTATIRVTGSNTAPTVGTVDQINTPTVTPNTGTAIAACPWNTLSLPDWGTNPVGANTYAYGGGTYARVWLSDTTAYRYWNIEIIDTRPAGTGYYIEVSRLIMGQYWSPKYNTGYGMTNSMKDLSTHERTESGDLVSQRGPRYSALTFDLKWLDPSDRIQLTRIMLGNGLPRPLLISLFPDNGTTTAQAEMERAHQIYGKMVTLPGITYDMLDIYSTQFDVEEV